MKILLHNGQEFDTTKILPSIGAGINAVLETPGKVGKYVSEKVIYDPKKKKLLPGFQASNKEFNKNVGDPTKKYLSGEMSRDEMLKRSNPYMNNMIMGFTGGSSGEIKKAAAKKLLPKIEATVSKVAKSGRMPQTVQTLPPPQSAAGPLASTVTPSSLKDTLPAIGSQVELDPVQKVIQALKEAKPIRGSQEALYRAERGKRLGKAIAVGNKIPGEAGYHAQLSQLKGELPKREFDALRGKLGQGDVDHLFKMVNDSPVLGEWNKLSAKEGLAKMFSGQVPTKSELTLLGRSFPPELVQELLNKRSTFEKMMEAGYEIANVPRALMASFDLSMPLRQGIVMTARHPIMSFKAGGKMIKAAFSPKAFQEINEEIVRRPTFRLMEEYKLPLTDMGGIISQREEQFMSGYANKIPIIGRIVKGSNRAAVTYLNKIRADVFDDFVKQGTKLGLEKDPEYLASVSKFVGAATGRGNLGALEKHATLLNSTLFSPRLVASRLNLLSPRFYAKLHPAVRKEAIKSMLAFASSGLAVLGLAKAGGAEVGDDIRSSDFGKIKIGNTRLDIWGGFQQYVKLGGQMATGEMINSTTGKRTELGEGYGVPTRFDILGRFFESKETPTISFASSALKGKDAIGQPFSLKKELTEMLVPLILQGAKEAIDEQGLDKGLLLTIPAIFGVGTQTYGYNPTSKKELKRAAELKQYGYEDKQINDILLKTKRAEIDKKELKEKGESGGNGEIKIVF